MLAMQIPAAMRHAVILLVVAVLGMASESRAENTAVIPVARESESWQARHAAMNARVAEGNVDLLWIGDSIVQNWERQGKSTWRKYYEDRHAVNLGISGDRTEHVLWRLDHGNIDGISPKLAIVMIGQNNGSINTGTEIGEGVRAVVGKLREKLPNTKVLLLAIFFRGEYPGEERERLTTANNMAAALADGEHVFYLDVNHIFLREDGSIPKLLMPDFEHPSRKGHRIWAEAIEPTVAKLMGD